MLDTSRWFSSLSYLFTPSGNYSLPIEYEPGRVGLIGKIVGTHVRLDMTLGFWVRFTDISKRPSAFETSKIIYQIPQRHVPQDLNPQQHRYKNPCFPQTGGWLVTFRRHSSDNGCVSAASRAAEGQRIFFAPWSVFSYNSCVPGASHAAGVKMEPVKVDNVIRSENGKIFSLRDSSSVSTNALLTAWNGGK